MANNYNVYSEYSIYESNNPRCGYNVVSHIKETVPRAITLMYNKGQ